MWCGKQKRFKEYDISTSQPRFLSKWAEEKISNSEMDNYKKALGLDIYKFMADKYNSEYKVKSPKTRNDMKIPFIKLLYCRHTTTNRITKLFNKLFPELYETINQFKKTNGYSKLAIAIQKMEADIVFRFLEDLRMPYYTVHDSINVLEGDSWVGEKFLEEINNYLDNKESTK